MRKVSMTGLALLGGFCISHALELKDTPFGELSVGGAMSGYIFFESPRMGTSKKTNYDIGSALLSVSKSPKPFGFTMTVGAYSLPVVGLAIGKTPDYTKLFSALPIAYLEYAPIDSLSVQVGKLPTLIGYESAFTYLNPYVQRGLIWNMQPVVHNGLRVSYRKEFFSLSVGMNDGFYTLSTKHAKPALELQLKLTPTKESSVAFNMLLPDKDARPNDTAIPANKRGFNLVATYSLNKLTLGTDLIYVEAPKSQSGQVPQKAKAVGGCVHLSYSLDPFSVAGRIEYVKDNTDNTDLVGLGDGNRAWTFTLSPGYKKGAFFARADLSYVKADKPVFGEGADKKGFARVGVEVGLSF